MHLSQNIQPLRHRRILYFGHRRIVEVKSGAYAGRFVRPGDMILAVNGQEVKSVAELKKRVASGINSINVGRDGVVFPVQFR